MHRRNYLNEKHKGISWLLDCICYHGHYCTNCIGTYIRSVLMDEDKEECGTSNFIIYIGIAIVVIIVGVFIIIGVIL